MNLPASAVSRSLSDLSRIEQTRFSQQKDLFLRLHGPRPLPLADPRNSALLLLHFDGKAKGTTSPLALVHEALLLSNRETKTIKPSSGVSGQVCFLQRLGISSTRLAQPYQALLKFPFPPVHNLLWGLFLLLSVRSSRSGGVGPSAPKAWRNRGQWSGRSIKIKIKIKIKIFISPAAIGALYISVTGSAFYT
jgi:hypothetical protein